MKGRLFPAAISAVLVCVALTTISIAHYRISRHDFTVSLVSDETSTLNPPSKINPKIPYNVPATVLPPTPSFPDFNGASAVIARHGQIQTNPTDLEEKKLESRGSFTVLMARAGDAEDGEVSLSIWGPATPFKCTIRGYRKLSGDFQGNTVATGYKQVFKGSQQIVTGLISPGVIGEYDILSCRSSPGEVQYFRINYDN
jgi:hypothetical protein